jgi:uncharacterized FAD-dependent dehydrogenase
MTLKFIPVMLGKPHLGTDRLVRILRNLRQWLTERGAEFEFGCRVEDFDLRHEAKTIFLAKDGEKSSLNADVIGTVEVFIAHSHFHIDLRPSFTKY